MRLRFPYPRSTLAGALLCVAPALAPISAPAAELAFQQSSGASLTYSDNLRLLPGSGNASAGYSAFHSASVTASDETRQLTGEVRLRANRFTALPQFNTFDTTISASGGVRLERDSFALASSYLRDSTLSSELTETGVVQPRVQRARLSVSPSWSHSLSPETSLQLSYAYSSTRYEAGTRLEDFSDHRVSAGLSHVLSPETTVSLSLSGYRFATESGSARTESVSASVGLNSALSERLSVNLQLGPDRTRTERRSEFLVCRLDTFLLPPVFCQFGFGQFEVVRVPVEAETRGIFYSAGAAYALEAGSVSANASRQQTPSGLGQVLRTTSFGAAYTRQWSERLSYGVTANYVESNSAFAQSGESRLYRIGPTARWQVFPDFALSLGYTYSQVRRSGVPDASENAVVLTGSYAWPRQATSF